MRKPEETRLGKFWEQPSISARALRLVGAWANHNPEGMADAIVILFQVVMFWVAGPTPTSIAIGHVIQKITKQGFQIWSHHRKRGEG